MATAAPRSILPPASADRRVFRYDDGSELAIAIESPQLLTTRVRGVGREAMVLEYIRIFHAFVDGAARPIDVFHDWFDVTQFRAGARTTFAAWGQEQHRQNTRLCRSVNMLVRSPLVYLALEAGGIKKSYAFTFSNRETFEAKLREARALPSTATL